MVKRQLTKAELLSQARNSKKLKKYARSMPYATVATVCNYVLWKEFSCTTDQLEEYNAAFLNRYVKADQEAIDKAAFYLQETYGISITVVLYEQRDWMQYRGKKILMEQKKAQMLAANEMFLTQQKYLVIHLLTLESMGYDADFLHKNKEKVSFYMSSIEAIEPEQMRAEMEKDIGLIIELPH